METNSFEQNEYKKDMIHQIFQIDPFDPNIEIDLLRNTLINAQKLLKERQNVSQIDNQQKPNAKDDDDSTASSNISNENFELEELKTSISKKNWYIKEILADIKASEEENSVLKNQVENLKRKLSEATTRIQDFSKYFKNVQSENIQYIEKIEDLEKAQSDLHLQITEVNNVNENYIEDFIGQMNIRLNEWKNILELKDNKISALNNEIIELKEKLFLFEQKESNLSEQIIKDRENQINDLKALLCDATKKIENSTSTIEKLKSDIKNPKFNINNSSLMTTELVHENLDFKSMKKDLQKYQKKIEQLKDCLQMREMEIAEIRKVDFDAEDISGERLQIFNKFVKQLNVRDKQILSLVAENNKNNHVLHQLQSENEMMRQKLNMNDTEIIFDTTYIPEKEKYTEKYNDVYQHLSSVSEENILLQIRLRQKEKNIRKLYNHLTNIGIKLPQKFISVVLSESSSLQQSLEENNNNIQLEKSYEKKDIDRNIDTPDTIQVSENLTDEYSMMKESHQHLVDENEGLRKCFHEILNAVKNKVVDSNCEIDLSTAESLLNILDSRHVAGWYHPAMKTLLELNYEKGFQNSLKTMLKDARSEITTTLDLLREEREKNVILEQKLLENINKISDEKYLETETGELNQPIPDAENSTNNDEIEFAQIKKSNQSYEFTIHKNLQNFHYQFQVLYDNMMEIFSQSNFEKMKWISMENNYKYEIENLSSLLKSMEVRINEVEKLKMISPTTKNFDTKVIDQCNAGLLDNGTKINNEQINVITENIDKEFPNINDILHDLENVTPEKVMKIRSLIELYLKTVEKNKYFERKNEYAEMIMKNFQCEKETIVNDFNEFKLKTLKSNKTYEVKIQKLLYELAELRYELKKSVPLSEFIKQNEKLNDFSMKYRKCMNKLHFENNSEDVNTPTNVDDMESMKNLSSQIEFLEKKNLDLQEQQNTFLSSMQIIWLKEDHELDIKSLIALQKDKEELEIQNIELNAKISSLEEELTSWKKTKLLHDMELNILKHQILDLQSSNDDKAIIARLNTENLIAHINIANMNEKEEIYIKNYEDEHIKRRKVEEILQEKEKEFTEYIIKSNMKISFLNSIIQILKEQYQGAVPLFTLEHLQDFQYRLQQKMNVFEKENSDFQKKNINSRPVNDINEFAEKCTTLDETKYHNFIEENKTEINISLLSSKLEKSEKENTELLHKISSLNNILLLLTFAFNAVPKENYIKDDNFVENTQKPPQIDSLDLSSDTKIRPIPKPRSKNSTVNIPVLHEETKLETDINTPKEESVYTVQYTVAETQTETLGFIRTTVHTFCQTDIHLKEIEHIIESNCKMSEENEIVQSNLNQSISMASERAAEILNLQTENSILKYKIENLQNVLEKSNECVATTDIIPSEESNDESRLEQFKAILENMKKIDEEKEKTIEKYKNLHMTEKTAHSDTKQVAEKKIYDLKLEMDVLEKECNGVKKMLENMNDGTREKNYSRMMELEDVCFRLQTELDNNDSSMALLKSECARWKNLAMERFTNMEKLKKQLEEKHNDEVVCYKLETSHWLSELSSTKNELSEMKIQLNDQRASTIQQMSEKNHMIENLQLSNIYLQQQLSNVLAMISEEESGIDLSQLLHLLDKNHLKTDDQQKVVKALNVNKNISKNQNYYKKSFENISISISKIQKENETLTKQNIILRRQIQILSEKEKRSKFENHNINSQKRGNTSANSIKFLQNKHEENNEIQKNINESSNMNENDIKVKNIELWNKQKRWQEVSEHWKQKYLSKCMEYDHLMRNYESSKNIIMHFEKEKRLLESRASKNSKISDGVSPSTVTGDCESHLEMLLQDKERLENEVISLKAKLEGNISQNSLMERLEAQQRRISAFELSDKGKDTLVSEYESLLTHNAILTKKIIKLETELLERDFGGEMSIKPTDSEENECCFKIRQKNEHLESYIKLLKEENSQLVAKNIEYDSMLLPKTKGPLEPVKNKSDLEKTIITLRGIINKIQSENKQLKSDSIQKYSTQFSENKVLLEMKKERDRFAAEIRDKDELLSRAKNLLRKAADNEKQLLRQIKMMKDYKLEQIKE